MLNWTQTSQNSWYAKTDSKTIVIQKKNNQYFVANVPSSELDAKGTTVAFATPNPTLKLAKHYAETLV